MNDEQLLGRAIELAVDSASTSGGPFGAILALAGEVAGTGTNRVTELGDPTAHAEVVAIRDACARLRTHVLSGTVLYASCEPCPMCLAAAWWARVDRIVFAADRKDAAAAGFDDESLYEEVAAPRDRRRLPITHLELAESSRPFAAWEANSRRLSY